MVVCGVTATGEKYLEKTEYTVDLGGLDFEKEGTYTITYTYKKDTSIKATLTVEVVAPEFTFRAIVGEGVGLIHYGGEEMPNSLFKKYIPDSLYVSSTVRVDKTAEGQFDYTVSHKGLALNNLNAEETEDLFHTLDAVLKIGSAESVNLQIGTIAVNALIGNEQSVGFAYSLKAVGATTFYFANITTAENSIDCFMVV